MIFEHSLATIYVTLMASQLWRTKQVFKTVLLSEMTLSLFGFMTFLHDHTIYPYQINVISDFPHQNISGSH